MNWFNRLGAGFLLCLFSLQTFASAVSISKNFTNKELGNNKEQFQVLHTANDQIIYQEPHSFFSEKIEEEAKTYPDDLNKFTSLLPKVNKKALVRPTAKTTFSNHKVFAFSSVQIIFPFHNFW